MFGQSIGAGGGDGSMGYGSRQGYQPRSRGRGGHETQEERYVEGDLFGNTKRASFRGPEPSPGQSPRVAYYDGAGPNAFTTGGVPAGYGHNPTAQASPFSRRPVQPSGAMPAGGHAVMNGLGAAYGSNYEQASPAMGGNYSSKVSFGGSVALVPVDTNSNGDSRGRSVADDEDDDMPTRSLADTAHASDGGVRAEGLRHRRGEGRVGGDVNTVFGGREEPVSQRVTWVVVWGVPPGRADDVLTSFLQFGHIEEQRGKPDSNWLYLKYATRLQAEKALASGHGSRLSETVMIGVQRVEDDQVWRELREGRIPPLSAGKPVLARGTPGRGPSANSQRSPGGRMQVDDADLLGGPPQRPPGQRSVCGKLIAYFGFY